MKIAWRSLSSEKEVRHAIERELALGSPQEEVRDFCLDEDLEFSSQVAGVIHASAAAPRRAWFIRSKWLVKFHFDRKDRLSKIEIERGWIGP